VRTGSGRSGRPRITAAWIGRVKPFRAYWRPLAAPSRRSAKAVAIPLQPLLNVAAGRCNECA
jgi:hypothetical protein